MSQPPLIDQFQTALEFLLDKWRDQGLSVGEAIGTLEIVKMDIYREIQEDDLETP